MSKSARSEVLFSIAGAALYAALTLVLAHPPGLTEPDSRSYLEFDAIRSAFYPLFLRLLTALGFGLEQIVLVQLLLFCAALMVLIAALRRCAMPKALIVVFVVLLGANVSFSSYHRLILSESLFFSLTAIALAFWLDYLRTGRAKDLAAASLCIGVLIGIRPASFALIPMLGVSVWLRWHRRDRSPALLSAALVAPMAVALLAETAAYRAVHDRRESMLPYSYMGKAAMLIRPGIAFHGPLAPALEPLGQALERRMAPVRDFLADEPSSIAWPALVAAYETTAQYQVLRTELTRAAAALQISENDLRRELGRQVILADIKGYVRLSLIHYLGQWSIGALTFPPASRAIGDYVARRGAIPLQDLIAPTAIQPPPRLSGYAVYPAFMAAGVATFVLTLLLCGFLVRPRLGDTGPGRYLMPAAVLAATCHVAMLATSFINVATSRYLMAVYPELVLAGLFALMALAPGLAAAGPNAEKTGAGGGI